jgi:hypothetical protein
MGWEGRRRKELPKSMLKALSVEEKVFDRRHSSFPEPSSKSLHEISEGLEVQERLVVCGLRVYSLHSLVRFQFFFADFYFILKDRKVSLERRCLESFALTSLTLVTVHALPLSTKSSTIFTGFSILCTLCLFFKMPLRGRGANALGTG